MIYKATVQTIEGPIHFEYEDFQNGPTVVALNGMLDEFKGQPVMDNTGKPALKYIERTTKDCTKIDGRVYFHRGRVSDDVLCRYIGIFLKALEDKSIWKKEIPGVILPGIVTE